ncbi:putative DDE superfamily endonuclease domain-containing protein [Phytophthora infestans]|uniref:Putative DDE superfamily endonuclease domain-containing protein n=1 Tax=Phytophthora infestans TaxID=4787 RepID=A0A833VU56_PHYIN|nr:putative DDE superfamily endonuclease domain-containing protein [Phytophthora infestans]
MAGMVFSPTATIPILLDLVELFRPPKRYQVTEIAAQYDHLVFFTPPYHPTLQPIELIWGIVKGRIARAPPKNANDAVKKVREGLGDCEGEWLKIYRHVQKKEDVYLKADKLH